MILASSWLTLYFIPWTVLQLEIEKMFFGLNLLLIGIVLGMVFLMQSIAKRLSIFFVNLFVFFYPADKTLKPLVHKNLDSHSLKNLYSNLLYSVTVCFLVF